MAAVSTCELTVEQLLIRATTDVSKTGNTEVKTQLGEAALVFKDNPLAIPASSCAWSLGSDQGWTGTKKSTRAFGPRMAHQMLMESQ